MVSSNSFLKRKIRLFFLIILAFFIGSLQGSAMEYDQTLKINVPAQKKINPEPSQKEPGEKSLSSAGQWLPHTPIDIWQYYARKGNKKMALYWFGLAAQGKNDFALLWVAQKLETGDDVQKNLPQALKYYVRAACGNDIEVLKYLFPFFNNLLEFQIDLNEIDSETKMDLSCIFSKGKAAEKDTILAYFWALSALKAEASPQYPELKKEFLTFAVSKERRQGQWIYDEEYFKLDEAVYKDLENFFKERTNTCMEKPNSHYRSNPYSSKDQIRFRAF